jgi:type II secretory ATPase GspE/PulE/Tfp pilus assembly ATPase PilB-like protein
VETVVRLIEMGIDSFNFADALLAIVAQRLTRRLCTRCKQAYHPTRDEYDQLVETYGQGLAIRDRLPAFSGELTLMRAQGCKHCEGQGYSGRIAIHEQLVNSPQLKLGIKNNVGVDKLQQIAVDEGMTTLRMDGIQKIFQGLTDLAQVNRVVI